MTRLPKCPCGDVHDPSPRVRSLLPTVEPNVVVRTLWGSWSVPRIYIAMHGLAAADLPALAKRFEWEKVVG